MIVKWLRENQIASGLLLLVRLYLGYSWVTSGFGKLTEGFDASGFLKGALAQTAGEHPSVQAWWAGFIKGFALPNVDLFNFLVPWGEFLVGLGLILGLFTTAAAFFGLVLNFSFMFSGATSTNPQMVLLTIFVAVAGLNAGRYGLDRYVIPYLHKMRKKPKKA